MAASHVSRAGPEKEQQTHYFLPLRFSFSLPFESLLSSLSFLGILKFPISFRTTVPRHQAWSWKRKAGEFISVCPTALDFLQRREPTLACVSGTGAMEVAWLSVQLPDNEVTRPSLPSDLEPQLLCNSCSLGKHLTPHSHWMQREGVPVSCAQSGMHQEVSVVDRASHIFKELLNR